MQPRFPSGEGKEDDVSPAKLLAMTAPARVPFRETAASVVLDLFRGLAALLVLLDHTDHLFFVSLREALGLTAHPFWMRLAYGLGSAGVEAVVVFFVLSGYLVSGSIYRDIAQKRWSWKRYLIHRVVRLWLVLLPALLLGVGWDLLRVWHHAGGSTAAFRVEAHAGGITPGILLGNIFFLQGIRLPTFGSNRVLWSLSCEFWYYMLFPLALFCFKSGESLRNRVVSGSLLLAIAGLVGKGVIALFPVWLMGSVLARLQVRQLGAFTRWLATGVYVPLFLWFAIHPWSSRLFKLDYVLGLASVPFLWIWLSADGRAPGALLPVRWVRRFAGFSYSLYLVHYPLLAFAAAIITRGVPWKPAGAHLLTALAIALVAILYSFAVASMTEFHNETVREWVETRLR